MLATLIYQKSIRRKDVKGVSKKKEPSNEVSNEAQPPINSDGTTTGPNSAIAAGNISEAKDTDPSDDELDQKTRQTTINLVGVDSNRVSMFATYAYFYPGTIIQIVVSVAFLGAIIGWKSLLVGLACFSLTIPMNIYTSRKYAELQARLMDVRDKKLAVTNEALQGIRQIKFSALEQQCRRCKPTAI
jgi:ABC transporter transmembrane region